MEISIIFTIFDFMKTMFDGLFEFESEDDLVLFTINMDKQSSIKILELAIEYGQKKGLYSIQESYCLYNCLLKLKENENKDGNLCNNDTDGDSNQ